MSIYFIESFNPILLNYENSKMLPRSMVGLGVPTPFHSWGSLPKSWKNLFCGIGEKSKLQNNFVTILIKITAQKGIWLKINFTPFNFFIIAHIHPVGGNALSWLLLIYENFKTWPKGGAPKIMLNEGLEVAP